MSKKFILWLDNGESYEDNQLGVLGVFSTRKRAEKAGKQAEEIIIQKAEEYMRRFPNAEKYYINISCFGIGASYLRHEIFIEELQEDTLRGA